MVRVSFLWATIFFACRETKYHPARPPTDPPGKGNPSALRASPSGLPPPPHTRAQRRAGIRRRGPSRLTHRSGQASEPTPDVEVGAEGECVERGVGQQIMAGA